MSITYNDLIERGYKQYPKSPLDYTGVVCGYQKRFKNSRGDTLYFITVKQWDSGRYDAQAQLYKYGTHSAVDLLFHSDWDLAEIEDYIELMYYDMGSTPLFEPYEKAEE